jgi:hypothetical protein
MKIVYQLDRSHPTAGVTAKRGDLADKAARHREAALAGFLFYL